MYHNIYIPDFQLYTPESVSFATLARQLHTSPLTVHFPTTRSVRYQPIFNGLKFTLHRARVLNNVVITTIIEMVEMVEILDGIVGKRSVERVRYVINNLLHLVIVKYGVILLVLCIFTRLRLVTILMVLVKYLVIFNADPCNKSYILGMCSFQHKWASERQLYLFVLLHHVIMK